MSLVLFGIDFSRTRFLLENKCVTERFELSEFSVDRKPQGFACGEFYQVVD
jgi:hypothetical protein